MSGRRESARAALVARTADWPRPTARGWGLLSGAAICAIVAYGSGWPALLVFACVLAVVPAIGMLLVVRRPHDFRVERRIEPAELPVGAAGAVTLRLIGQRRSRDSVARWRELHDPGVGVDDSSAVEVGTATGTVETVRYVFSPVSRGERTVGPFVAVRTDPFGVASAERRIGGSARVLVLPRIHRLAHPMTAGAALGGEEAVGPRAAARRPDSAATRVYRSGDPLRSVHWRATAHRGEIMVRQEEPEADRTADVVLEARAGRWADDAEFEWGVEAAASIIARLDADGLPVRLRILGDGGDEPPTLDGRAALVRLATVSSDGTGDRVPAVLRVRPSTMRFAVLARPAAGEVRALGPGGAALVLGIDRSSDAEAAGVALTAAGWRWAPVDTGDRVDEAWAEAVAPDARARA